MKTHGIISTPVPIISALLYFLENKIMLIIKLVVPQRINLSKAKGVNSFAFSRICVNMVELIIVKKKLKALMRNITAGPIGVLIVLFFIVMPLSKGILNSF